MEDFTPPVNNRKESHSVTGSDTSATNTLINWTPKLVKNFLGKPQREHFWEMQPLLWLSSQEATTKNYIRSIWKHTA